MTRLHDCLRRLSGALGLAIALLGPLASPAEAGPVSTLYLASYTSKSLYAIQGDSVTTGALTYCNHCEVAIAVDGDIRTMSSIAYGYGGQYRLDRSQTGTTYAFPFAPEQAPLLGDGATDGARNYAVGGLPGTYQTAIWSFDRNWADPVLLFLLDANIDGSGITYDPTNRSLWITGTLHFDGGSGGVMRDYALDGSLLSQFAAGTYGGGGLAMDYRDGTLWTTRGPTRYFDQYTRSGELMQTVTYDTLGGLGSTPGIEFNLADARSLPEPGSLASAAAALAAALAVRRRSLRR